MRLVDFGAQETQLEIEEGRERGKGRELNFASGSVASRFCQVVDPPPSQIKPVKWKAS